jgi:hypothetical protein
MVIKKLIVTLSQYGTFCKFFFGGEGDSNHHRDHNIGVKIGPNPCGKWY